MKRFYRHSHQSFWRKPVKRNSIFQSRPTRLRQSSSNRKENPNWLIHTPTSQIILNPPDYLFDLTLCLNQRVTGYVEIVPPLLFRMETVWLMGSWFWMQRWSAYLHVSAPFALWKMRFPRKAQASVSPCCVPIDANKTSRWSVFECSSLEYWNDRSHELRIMLDCSLET